MVSPTAIYLKSVPQALINYSLFIIRYSLNLKFIAAGDSSIVHFAFCIFISETLCVSDINYNLFSSVPVMTYFSDRKRYNLNGDTMVIYIDVLIVINIYITYFTLKATSRLFHSGYKLKRLIAASVLGGISSVSAVLPLSFLPAVLLRFALTTAITLTAFGYSGIKPLVMRSLTNICAATLVCGGAILLREATGNSFFAAAGGYAYLDVSILTLVFATTAVYFVLSLFRRIADKPAEGELITVKIKQGDKTAIVYAYPDSGNNLRDFLSGKPVIICRKDRISGLMPKEKLRIIPFSSVGGSGIVTAFRPDCVTVKCENGEEKTVDVLIGTGGDSLENESFDAILNPKILI